jgi:SAM-dependent methyltransferase
MLTLEHLDAIRAAEGEKIVSFFTPGARILEIGAGTGTQALQIKRHGYDIVAIEMANSNYAKNRIFPIIDYDGRHIPLPDSSIDIVFSSNVLEHVPDLPQLHGEIRRVLRPDGYCIHVLPTHIWRCWSILTSFPEAVVGFTAAIPQLVPCTWPNRTERRRLGVAWYRAIRYVGGRVVQRRHGERGNAIFEIWLFHPQWWRRHFRNHGFCIDHDEPMGLFYTGNALLGRHLGLARRARIANSFGSACHLFKLTQQR